jgi:hypothetical protein
MPPSWLLLYKDTKNGDRPFTRFFFTALKLEALWKCRLSDTSTNPWKEGKVAAKNDEAAEL